VTFNFSVVAAGRQYDRLGIMYFNDTEVFRTSTAEPTARGIYWSYTKDMSNYLALFKQPQKIIFDLGNLVNDIYTASLNATLTATFFTEADTPRAADLILPVSARQSATNGSSVFTIPGDNATNTLSLPRNVERAVFTIASCGQQAEEFWWGNVFSSQVDTFSAYDTTLYGYSPWRELQLYIDGMLAGVAWPFPVIFTGGVVPGFWRPIVGIDAYDLREDEIDITPFLPLLCDGSDHTFEMRVVGINDDGHNRGSISDTVGAYWLVSGKIFIWENPDGSVTKGSAPRGSYPHPAITLTSTIGKTSNGSNATLDYSIEVSRTLSISSTIKTSKGSKRATWDQNLKFSSTGSLTNEGNTELNIQHTSGTDISSSGYAKSFSYPLWVNESYIPTPGSQSFALVAAMDRGKSVTIVGQSVFPQGLSLTKYAGSSSNTRQNGTAVYTSIEGQATSTSWGSTEQEYDFSGLKRPSLSSGGVELYHRHVLAVNGTVREDDATLLGKPLTYPHSPAGGAPHKDFAPFASQNFKFPPKSPPVQKRTGSGVAV
jgi:hypothetical protein